VTAPHWRAQRGAHAYRLRGAASRPLGRRPAASVRPTHGGAGHRASHHRATPPQPLFRRGAAGAWVTAAGNSAALAVATRRARTPAAGRRQSAFGAAPRRLSAAHAGLRRPRTAAHPRSHARVSVGTTRRACINPAGEPPGDVLGVSAPPQCAHRRSAQHLRQRRPGRNFQPHHSPFDPIANWHGVRAGDGGWPQRRICGRHTARAHTDCEAPPFGLRSAPPPPDCAAPAAAAASAPHAAGAEPLSPRPIEASRKGGL